jgi:hypothetical protein
MVVVMENLLGVSFTMGAVVAILPGTPDQCMESPLMSFRDIEIKIRDLNQRSTNGGLAEYVMVAESM